MRIVNLPPLGYENLMITAKALGHFSPYGSYWAALSLINDAMDKQIIEKHVSHVENWSKTHLPLRPRYLHLRAELACSFDAFEARRVISHTEFRLSIYLIRLS